MDKETPMTPSTELAVRRNITVEAPIERAFEVFTAGFDRWWPRSHHLVQGVEMKTAVLETKLGGRWYELNEDGSTCDWGRVIVWEPPTRLVLAWQITGDFTPEPDPERASQIAVTFTDEGSGRTRVDVVHDGFERHADPVGSYEGVSGQGGWTTLFELYAAAVAA
jgi:uncharacterized protein YndB with AHSA1/START domain